MEFGLAPLSIILKKFNFNETFEFPSDVMWDQKSVFVPIFKNIGQKSTEMLNFLWFWKGRLVGQFTFVYSNESLALGPSNSQ